MMLRRENELRLSPEVQEAYRVGGYSQYTAVTEALQLQVAAEFGIDPPSLGMQALWYAESLAPSDAVRAQIKEISLYRKYNRMRDGPLRVGDPAPPLRAPLLQVWPMGDGEEEKDQACDGGSVVVRVSSSGKRYRLEPRTWHLRGDSRPLVVVASSHS
jgi:hypothetical protein